MTDRRPLYQRLVDTIGERIRSGALAPGSALPPERQLAADHGVSTIVVRRALQELRALGLVYTEHGRATFVRPVIPVRRLSQDRYQRAPGQPHTAVVTPFTRDHGTDWTGAQLDREFAEVDAPADVADLLQVPAGARLLQRRFVFHTGGYPQQMSTSYLLLDMVAGTPIVDPDREPWPGGTIAQMATVGVVVTTVDEMVRARMPSRDESQTLRIPTGVPVLAITRVMRADERPVEAAVDIVIPADRVELAYRIEL